MAFSQGFGKMQDDSRRNAPGRGSPSFARIAFGGAWRGAAFRRMLPEIFCMAGGHTGAQSSGFCVRMLILMCFGKMQINFCRMPPGDSRTAVPFCVGCPPHTGARRKKIPYPVSFGIRHFEKGVNERGISPASRSVPVRTGIHSLPLPGSPGWAVPIWRTCCRGYWQGPANQR